MHAAATAPGTSGLFAKQLGDQLSRLHALGQGMAVAAVRTKHNILPAQVMTHPCSDGLLTDIRVTGTVNQPALVRPGQSQFRLPDELH